MVFLHRAAFLCADTSQYRNLSRQSPITPPPDPEADIARDRGLEEQARKALLEAGWPPCYPINLEFPLQNVPEKYEAVSYWQSLPGTGRVPLRAQLSDLESFRNYQGQVRRYYLPREKFGDFMQKVRDRRRRHGLKGHVCLRPDPKQQSQLETWIEFQNYHLDIHERLEEEMTNDRQGLDMARKKLETGTSEATDAEHVEMCNGKVRYSESKLRNHDKQLQWIEQQRIAMATEQATCTHATGGHDRPRIMPTPTSPGRRKRDQKPRSPLSPVRSAVLKKPRRKRESLGPQEFNIAQVAEKASADSNAPRRSRRKVPDVGDKSARRGEESTPLGPFRPQKVTSRPRRRTHIRAGNSSTSKSS